MRALVVAVAITLCVGCADETGQGSGGVDVREDEPNDNAELSTVFELAQLDVAYSFSGEIGGTDEADSFVFSVPLELGEPTFVVEIDVEDLDSGDAVEVSLDHGAGPGGVEDEATLVPGSESAILTAPEEGAVRLLIEDAGLAGVRTYEGTVLAD